MHGYLYLNGLPFAAQRQKLGIPLSRTLKFGKI